MRNYLFSPLVVLMLGVVCLGAKCNNTSHHLILRDPRVISTEPVDHATAVPLTQLITATFSVPMDPATINTTTFVVQQNSLPVTGTVTYASATATFTPAADLQPNTIYLVRLTTGAMDLLGRHLISDHVWHFTTVSNADSVPPVVDSTIPVNVALNVPINMNIEAAFSEAMAPASLNTSTFLVMQGTTPVTGTVSASGAYAVFSPTGDLGSSLNFTVTITTGATDLAGNALQSDFTWSFTTGTSSDLAAPTVTSVVPADSSTDITLNAKIKADFSEAMNPLTLTASSFTLVRGVTSVAGTVSYSGTEAIFTPDANLLPNTLYTATVTTAAVDLAGNSLTSDKIWSFTTGTTTSPITAVALGHADHFVILAGSGIGTTPTNTITGDLGLSPAGEVFITGLALTDATSYATSAQVTGLIYAADMADPTPAMLTQAKGDLTLAYNDAAGRLPTPTGAFFNPGSGDMAGLTLASGLYKFSGTATATAAFTLDGGANDVWIFQIPGDLNVSNGVHVSLINGAQARNIFWQIGSQAT
ncbi:MAG TPA: Ig-like domain-containing protein, partial [Planctomycetota bacterium]|nr:Ig-like domain-containing protein [Planctomycetota bacterium]